MTKYKCFFDFGKEEAWLADLSRQGYKLTYAQNGCYKFDYIGNSYPDLVFKVDYRTFHKKEDFLNYCTMFEDSGWLHIAGSRHSGSQYFVKLRPDATGDIFSDNLSRAGRYKRLSSMWLGLACTFTAIMISLSFSLHVNFSELYLTPGLWEMKGWHFVTAFLFETPFALFRLAPLIIYPLIILYYLYYTFKSYSLYKKELGQLHT